MTRTIALALLALSLPGLTGCGRRAQPGQPVTEPARRYATAADVIDGVVYVVGGMERGSGAGRDVAVATVEAYDPDAGTWTRCASMSVARAFPAAAAFDGRLYVFGGLGEDGGALASAEAYDPRTDTWSACAPMEEPRSRAAAVRHIDTGIIVAGGTRADSSSMSDQRIFLPREGGIWRWWVPPLDPARHGLGLVDADDGTERMLAVGGFGETGALDRVDWWGVGTVRVRDENGNLLYPGARAEDPETGEMREIDEDYEGYGWWPGPPLHVARGFHGTARIGRLVYAVGGRCPEIPPTEVLDLDDLESGWREAAPLPRDLCRFSLVAWNGRLLAFGGETDSGRTVNTDVLEYDPGADAWSVR